MIESRCGLLCSSCEGRSLPHCGMCGDFPCEQLKGFSYDPQRGDGGARIVQCEKWREET